LQYKNKKLHCEIFHNNKELHFFRMVENVCAFQKDAASTFFIKAVQSSGVVERRAPSGGV
jgi:hypothetical protein